MYKTRENAAKIRLLLCDWLSDWPTDQPTNPRSRVLLGKQIFSQLINKFHALYGNRKFITAFKTAGHLSLFRAKSIQSTPQKIFILSLSLHLLLGLPSSSFPQAATKRVYEIFFYPINDTYPAHLIFWCSHLHNTCHFFRKAVNYNNDWFLKNCG